MLVDDLTVAHSAQPSYYDEEEEKTKKIGKL
jgi:hypothetical protein